MTDKLKAELSAGPRAILRTQRLFEALALVPEGLSLSDLSIRLSEPKSTLLNSLRVLESEGFLNIEGTLYRLGPRAFRLAAQISNGWSLPTLMRGYLRELARRADETALLSVIDPTLGRSVHIDAIESRNRIRYVLTIGSGGPLYATASGRVLLAHQTQQYQDDYVQSVAMEPLTPFTTTDKQAFREQLNQIRKDGVWVSKGEIQADGGAIAAPVFGPQGKIAAAVSVALPLTRLEVRQEELSAIVKDIAARASGQARTPVEGMLQQEMSEREIDPSEV